MFDSTPSYQIQRDVYAAQATRSPSIMFSENLGLRLSRKDGSVTTELMTLAETGLIIGRVKSTGHEIGLREADRLTILVPRIGRLGVRIGASHHDVTLESPMAFRPGERHTTAITDRAGRFVATTLQVSMDRVRMLAEMAEGPVRQTFMQDAVAMRSRIGLQVLRSLAWLSDDIFLLPRLPMPPKMIGAIGHWVDEHLLSMIDGPTEPPLRRLVPAFHRVRQAEEIMHAHSDDPLSMIDLAQRLGLSLRSLQLAFNLVHDGRSPREIFNCIRLQRARERLLSAGGAENVTTIALDSGFFHLGRFSQSYARAFGERPSETLARRRA